MFRGVYAGGGGDPIRTRGKKRKKTQGFRETGMQETVLIREETVREMASGEPRRPGYLFWDWEESFQLDRLD